MTSRIKLYFFCPSWIILKGLAPLNLYSFLPPLLDSNTWITFVTVLIFRSSFIHLKKSELVFVYSWNRAHISKHVSSSWFYSPTWTKNTFVDLLNLKLKNLLFDELIFVYIFSLCKYTFCLVLIQEKTETHVFEWLMLGT